MGRYFLEVAYKGTKYCGFQIQKNGVTVQSEVEKAFFIIQRKEVVLTGSSRTDAGVHALQNFFHFDIEEVLHPQLMYKMNAVLPVDIVVKGIYPVTANAHCRFDAVSREYEYRIYQRKNPFLKGLAFYYPYQLDMVAMQKAAAMVAGQTNFFAFAKTNSQVKNYTCALSISEWKQSENLLIYHIKGNRFLRGMVRLLTASMLMVGRGRLPIETFSGFFSHTTKCGYSIPPEGLYLIEVEYEKKFFGG